MKKILCMILCLAMLLALAACGGGGETEKRGDENQNQFLIVGGMSALSSGNDSNPVLMELAENAGVEIEWDLMSDSLGEKVGVLIGGNQLPDAFIAVGFNQNDIVEYGSDGVFIDLTPYITPEIMPKLSKILDEHPEIRAGITQADGCIYGLPSGELMGTGAIGADDDLSIYAIPEFSMINKTWLDELGLDMPTNLTELHDVLVAFKENNMGGPNTIPMSTGFDQWCWGQEIFYAGFGFTNFTSDICFDLLANPDGTVQFICASQAYRDAVTYFHDWYAEGLMDLEMFSQGTSQLISKVSQGRVGVATWWEIHEIAGDYTDDFVFLHLEASDEAGHDSNLELKIRTIEYLDHRIVEPIYNEVKGWQEPVCIAVLPDHPTPVEIRTHVNEPVPFLIWHPGIEPDDVTCYDELSTVGGHYGMLRLEQFMQAFMNS